MTSSRENIELLKRLWIFPACLLAIASEYVYRGGELILSIFFFLFFYNCASKSRNFYYYVYTQRIYSRSRRIFFVNNIASL